MTRAPRRYLPLTFGVVALGLLLGAWLLPAGVGRLPGPAFFPAVVGLVMLGLSVALYFRETAAAEKPAAHGGVVRVVILTFCYLLLWGTGFFGLRTTLFLALLLRGAGESWRRSLAVAFALTAAVIVAFQWGLKVSLE